MRIGNTEFEIGKRTYIMGILNVTPDSFSDGGSFNSLQTALKHAKEMIDEGADIIDVGGESTRPGHEKISEEEEIKRVIPVIAALKSIFLNTPVSIDTYKPAVAEAAIKAGADMVNDIWGFRHSEKMAGLTAEYDLPCCLMHNRDNTRYENIIEEMVEDLTESIEIALKNGVSKSNIILDPGIGFGKTYEQNLFVLNNMDKLTEKLPYPFLLGASRKSTIGKALGDLPTDQRLEGTLATTAIGIMKGCDFVRVHDVKENKRAAIMSDKIRRSSLG